MRHLTLLATLATTLALGPTACGDDDDNPGADGSVGPDAAAPGPDATQVDAAPGTDATTGQDAAMADASPGEDASPDGAPGPDVATATCGNGVLESGEACDDGNTVAGDYCAADCAAVTGSCGDGTLQSNETCDDGVLTADCDTWHDGGDSTCVPPGTCSTGYVPDAGGDCVAAQQSADVWIDVDNFCNLTVTPQSFTVPAGQTLTLTYHNLSAWYPVDVWLSYGGGFLDLQTGATWADAFDHCFGPSPSTAYADIDTACSSFRLYIYCQ